MLVPDQSHINRVRDALWQRSGGGASVMVGSGFSRNALKTRPDVKALPMWDELAREMSHELYPQEAGGPSALDGPLRLAQEYKTAFGRNHLHRFLQQLVRDEDFRPGGIHTRLLRLPWRDVFTTNWDTLLERTQTSVAERAYSVVRNMNEIPLANRPRIVKLHGSFPAYFPLIFTEEDYRTYPTKFAPFVNTVQQAMMESVFCLIGFSGDDPNFLQWSGWVRDNLGDAAPKIYLAGWLNLSSHRRRMLGDRNVVPIDLARHPKAGEWPAHLRHDYATKWILHTLERGQPYDVTNWPSPTAQVPAELPAYLEPIEVVTSDTPKEEPSPSSSSSESGSTWDSVRQTLDVWAHNRKIYPGWLVVPGSARSGLSWNTHEWEPHVLRALPNFTPVERLNAVRELVWRREVLLEPLSVELESAAEETLKLIDCQRRTIDGIANPGIQWTTVREAWWTIALALVTVARHRFDRASFDRRIATLSPFLQDHPDVDYRIRHERCLWAAYSMDFETLDNLLKKWRTENCDPAWMIRKAALLFEIGRGDEATSLARHALTTIREMPADNRSLAGPSREGWALYSVARFEDVQVVSKRWNELAPLECNALMEKRHITDALKSEGETEEAPSFDLGTQRGQHLRFSNVRSQDTAYRAIRLSEGAGLPPLSGGAESLSINVATEILRLAAEKLSVSDSEMAIRLVLRVCTDDKDKTLRRILSRPRVAALPAGLVKSLTEICQKVIAYALPRISGTRAYPVSWIERMRVAIEALSRLVLRLEPDVAETTFDKALEHYRNDRVTRHPWLSIPVQNLLKRSWGSLPEERRTARVLDLLDAPIVGLDNFADAESRYPDPGELLQADLPPPPRVRDNESRWQAIVNLLVRGLQAGAKPREQSSSRIASVAFRERITEAEAMQVARALWSEEHTGPYDLPSGTSLFDWVFFLLPEPELGLAEQRFRQKWLDTDSLARENAPSLDDILWQVGHALSSLKINGRPLSLSDTEQSYLTDVVERWADTPIPHHFFPPMEDQRREPTRRALDGLPSVLAEIHIPESVGEKLYKKVQDLNQSEMPGFGLIPGLAKAIPSRLDGLALLMRTGLSSEDDTLARGAAVGLYHWLTTSADADSQTPPPPDDLVREIGVLIATRRKVSLGLALQIAKWVFDEGSDTQRKVIRDLALQGLGSLAEELRYDREHAQEDNIDVPLLRWRSTQLAHSMAARDSEKAPAVSRWLEMAEEDPLPEVRYAKSPTVTHQA